MPLSLDVDTDLEDVVEGFNEMTRAGRDLRRAWRDLKPVLKVDLREHFRQREGPDGKWEPRQPRQRNRGRRRRRRGPLLGKLRTAFRIVFDRKELRALGQVPWAHIHQDGGTAGKGAQIPQRTHMYMSKEFVDIVVKRILDHITQRF